MGFCWFGNFFLLDKFLYTKLQKTRVEFKLFENGCPKQRRWSPNTCTKPQNLQLSKTRVFIFEENASIISMVVNPLLIPQCNHKLIVRPNWIIKMQFITVKKCIKNQVNCHFPSPLQTSLPFKHHTDKQCR